MSAPAYDPAARRLTRPLNNSEMVKAAAYQGYPEFEAAIDAEVAELRAKLALLRSRLGPPDGEATE